MHVRNCLFFLGGWGGGRVVGGELCSALLYGLVWGGGLFWCFVERGKAVRFFVWAFLSSLPPFCDSSTFLSLRFLEFFLPAPCGWLNFRVRALGFFCGPLSAASFSFSFSSFFWGPARASSSLLVSSVYSGRRTCSSSPRLRVVLPHLPVGKKFLRFCLVKQTKID